MQTETADRPLLHRQVCIWSVLSKRVERRSIVCYGDDGTLLIQLHLDCHRARLAPSPAVRDGIREQFIECNVEAAARIGRQGMRLGELGEGRVHLPHPGGAGANGYPE